LDLKRELHGNDFLAKVPRNMHISSDMSQWNVSNLTNRIMHSRFHHEQFNDELFSSDNRTKMITLIDH
jgi:hypothetical protein